MPKLMDIFFFWFMIPMEISPACLVVACWIGHGKDEETESEKTQVLLSREIRVGTSAMII